MKKRSSYVYLLLAIALFGLWNMPQRYNQTMRSWAATISAPVWHLVAMVYPTSDASSSYKEEATILRIENNYLKSLVQQELSLLEQLAALQYSDSLTAIVAKHRQTLLRTIEHQLAGIPARVIYRSPSAWNSSLWLDVGEKDNSALQRTVVAINSPVLREGALVGIVDYVGEQQSRIRLISDVGLTPSVRSARGGWRDSWLSQQIHLLQRQLHNRDDLLPAQDKESLLLILSFLAQQLQSSSESWLLAKGELHGSSQPLWRLPGQLLKGIGFNYDFADEEGPSRDLRTGAPSGQLSLEGSIPLLKVKDLLITTGYDGVFPAGLPVAEVTRISPLNEGDYYYELEAKPCMGSLVDIDTVYVLPPVGFAKDDQPPNVIW